MQPPTFSAAAAPPHLFAGTSGWAYPTWKPAFYPDGLSSRDFLAFYASEFPSVEVNYTFTRLPTPEQTVTWLAATPPGFRFSFKAPQRITHILRLRDTAADPLAEFLAALQPFRKAARLGAILFQLPPNFKASAENHSRLAAFLRLPALQRNRIPIAFEFRHGSWFTEPTCTLLRKRRAALCIAETDDLLTPEILTAPHTYVRLRRSGGYSPARLKAFAGRFTAIARDRDTFLYFRHEEEPTGALNARAFLRAASRLSAQGGAA